MVERKSFTTVDILKFFFCICVIMLHTGILDLFSEEIKFYITRVVFHLAVPYFFVASGFFLGKKYRNAKDGEYITILKGYIKRLSYPFLFFTLIGLRQQWTTMVLENKTDKLLYLLKRLAFYPFNALWFVEAIIVAAILIYPFIKMKHGVTICVIAGLILYIFALTCNNYYFVVENTRFEPIINNYINLCYTARNGIFVGIVYLSIGIKCYDIYLKTVAEKKRRITVCLLCVLSLIMYIAEVYLLHYYDKSSLDDNALDIVQLILLPSLFLVSAFFSVNIPIKITVLLRNLSTGMYYLHVPVMWWVCFYASTCVQVFFAVVIISFLICILSYKIDIKRIINKYYLLR